MSLQPKSVSEVPTETARVARAAFRKGNPYLRFRDEFGALFTDQDFVQLYPSRGQPALSPGQLALVTLVQFTENLTDRQMAERGAALLAKDPHYQALVSPVLCRIEVNAGVASTDAGHLCLRYDVTGGTPQEFWPHWGKTDRVNWKSGQISVNRDG